MAGLGVEIRLTGVEGAQAQLHALQELGADLTPIYDEIGAAMVSSQQNRFELGVEPDGTPWMQSWRAREQGGKTLIDSGLLLSRLTHNADAGGVEWGFNDRRAPTLHFGAVIHSKKGLLGALLFKGSDGHWVMTSNVVIPARPIVGVDEGDIQEIETIIAGAAERAAGGGTAQ